MSDILLRRAERLYSLVSTLENFEGYRIAARRAGNPLSPQIIAENYSNRLQEIVPEGVACFWDDANYSSGLPEYPHIFVIEIFWFDELDAAMRFGDTDVYLKSSPSQGVRDIYRIVFNLRNNAYQLSGPASYFGYDIDTLYPGSGMDYFIQVEENLGEFLRTTFGSLGWERVSEGGLTSWGCFLNRSSIE